MWHGLAGADGTIWELGKTKGLAELCVGDELLLSRSGVLQSLVIEPRSVPFSWLEAWLCVSVIKGNGQSKMACIHNNNKSRDGNT